jgi:polygalacturonase
LLSPPIILGASYYPNAKAIYLTKANFPLHGDGSSDDTQAIQQAIDKVDVPNHEGIVFLPSSRYRLTAPSICSSDNIA